MADTYVLVHGAWHTGAEMEAVAGHLRKGGHVVHCPTIAGNNKDDDREKTGLEQAISSIVTYIEANNLRDIRLVGHSYGGMVISGVADRLTDRIKRLVYVNAFVPLDGECLNDMVPPHYVGLFDAVAAANKGAVMLPFEIWRDAFINDADLELAKSAYAKLNLHPYKTFTDKITLKLRWRNCRSANPTSIAGRTSPCRTACHGIRGCRNGWGFSGWSNATAATKCSSVIRRGWRRRSRKPGATEICTRALFTNGEGSGALRRTPHF